MTLYKASKTSQWWYLTDFIITEVKIIIWKEKEKHYLSAWE